MRVGVVFTGLECLEQSVFYQDIVEEGVAKGELQGARHALIVYCREAFGKPPSRRARASIEAIDTLEQLEQLVRRATRVRSWDELLPDVPALKPPTRRRKRR